MGFKAEGLIGGAVKTTCEWKAPLSPVALALEADRPVITADGADLSRIIATAIDTNGTPVETCALPVTFSIDGLGQLIGENPVKLRGGKMIILAQSAFVPGEMTIIASAPGLRSAKVTVKTEPVLSNVDMPKDLPAKRPTPRPLPDQPSLRL
jgi:beta-galactosidase